jgi:hypothetical protein
VCAEALYAAAGLAEQRESAVKRLVLFGVIATLALVAADAAPQKSGALHWEKWELVRVFPDAQLYVNTTDEPSRGECEIKRAETERERPDIRTVCVFYWRGGALTPNPGDFFEPKPSR